MSHPLAKALDRCSVADVHAWLMGASDKDRRAALALVTDRLKEGPWFKPVVVSTLGLALLGCAPTAKRAAAALSRLWSWDHIPRDALLEVLRKREIPWIAELALALAGRLDTQSWSHDWRLVDALICESGAPIPTSAGFTAGWLSAVREAQDSDLALRQSPYTAALLPMLFEHERIGVHLAYTFNGKGFNPALVRLSHDDPAVREVLVTGCLSRLLRGGRPGDLRPYVELYEHLGAATSETRHHVADYIGLLSSRLGTAASMAQRALRALDEADLLDFESLLEASSLALDRSEKVIVKAQTSWIRKAAKRYPQRAGELLALLDVPAPPEIDVVAFAPPVSSAMPAAIATPAELAEELAALVSGDWSPATSERVLAGLISLRVKDHQALQDALTPVVQAHWETLNRLEAPVVGVLTAALATTVSMADSAGALHNLVTSLDAKLRHLEPLSKLAARSAGLGRMMEHRLAEIATQANRAPVSFLVSTPTQLNGQLDPAVLLKRLEVAEEQGRQPWPIDFAQALLRLPREIDPAVLRDAFRLHSPAGLRFAKRVHSGHPDPVSTPVLQCTRIKSSYGWHEKRPDRRRVVALEPATDLDPIEQVLFTLVPPEAPAIAYWWDEHWLQLGAAAMPSHREVVAAEALPTLATQADINSGRGAALLLPLLAECEGPAEIAVALAITYGLTAKEAIDRVAAVDALIGFGSSLDATAVGRELGEACAAGALTLTRAVSALKHATEAGAVAVVWQICLAAIPSILGTEKPRPGAADLLEIANTCARTLRANGVPAEVSERAQRGGSSRLAIEARKLQQTLQG